VSKPDPADVLVARAADRLALIDMQNDAAAALALCKELHDRRADVQICLRYDAAPSAPSVRRTMPARFPGRCTKCAGGIQVGEAIFVDYEARNAVHARCA
jgi:hypothetical protein